MNDNRQHAKAEAVLFYKMQNVQSSVLNIWQAIRHPGGVLDFIEV